MDSLGFKEETLKGYGGELKLKRNQYGVPCIKGRNMADLYFGLGWVHAYDRLAALELTRLVAKGRAAEYLDPKMLSLDIAMRLYNLWGDAVSQSEELTEETRELMETYCAGINHRLTKVKLPFEFKLINYKPEPWTPAESIMLSKMIGIVDMIESQGWIEKFIIQMLQQGLSLEQLKELFPYITEEPGEGYLDIIREVKLPNPIVPETAKWAVLPRLQGSNGWVVSGKKSASGSPILCGAPHLDTARLPAIWQEVIMQAGDYFFTGATVPGIPTPVLGRTADLTWSVTFGFMDVIDYFIEEVKDGHYRKGSRWLPFKVREESIGVKNGKPVTVRYYENEHGTLEQEPHEDGYYPCFAWSASRDCGAETMENGLRFHLGATVKEAMASLAHIDVTAYNWIIADKDGNLGYQMSGRSPVRKEGCSGLLPLPGWDEKYDWQGYHDRSKNPSLYNPPEQFIVSANHDMNFCADTNMISLAMAPYRAWRITELLEERDEHSVEKMQEMQYDLYSKQAEMFMEKIKPLLPDSEQGRLLREWDLHYESGTLAPALFENIYRELAVTVFGTFGFGTDVFKYLFNETVLFHIFHGNFDRVMLSDRSAWFAGKTGREILGQAIEKGLAKPARPYGSERKFILKNLLLGGRLPKFMGFDYGPVELIGSRASVAQGQIFISFGRQVVLAPVYKFVTELKEEAIYSVLAGGPSDRRFSRWYTSGIEDWLAGIYRRMEPQ